MESKDEQHPDLLQVLVEHKVISAAQAELVEVDAANTGMLPEEVLLVRRWIQPETLYQLAPWIQLKPQIASDSRNNLQDYQTNLAKYRTLINQIIDEQQ